MKAVLSDRSNKTLQALRAEEWEPVTTEAVLLNEDEDKDEATAFNRMMGEIKLMKEKHASQDPPSGSASQLPTGRSNKHNKGRKKQLARTWRAVAAGAQPRDAGGAAGAQTMDGGGAAGAQPRDAGVASAAQTGPLATGCSRL